MPNELGLRNVTFEVDDLQAILDRRDIDSISSPHTDAAIRVRIPDAVC